MRIKRAASIPLILHDPYFSIWSSADHLYDADPVHWCGKRQQIRGYITVDDAVYSFLGDKEFHKVIPQRYADLSATATEYGFENEKIRLTVRFVSPLLLEDPVLVSRPCTYMNLTVHKKTACEVSAQILLSDDLVCTQKSQTVGCSYSRPAVQDQPAFTYASMGKAAQRPLGNSGDNITIDWGYVYLASDSACADLYYDAKNSRIGCHVSLQDGAETGLIIAYDDMISIHYFGQWRKALWTSKYATILDAIGSAFADRKEVLARAEAFDADIEAKASALGGEAYAFLCCASYRHAVAAHKLITDENGEILFLSKENDSNGCIGTVDVSYPSVPLFLLYNTEYVKGMLRPIFHFTRCDVWEFDFAPHDVGRYPYAWGQVYGLNGEEEGRGYTRRDGEMFPPYYQYPKTAGVYDLRWQMPVEESGNMLILTAAVCMLDGSPAFAVPYMDILEKWVAYLLKYGADPGEQLCTDDFAGHLAHNVNLSVKAIMGIEGYSILLRMSGQEAKADEYHAKAKDMARMWEQRAFAGDHYALAFGLPETWSLKYNLIWDRLFGSGLFPEQVFKRELAYYVKNVRRYGTPLDNRNDYVKSDWILWCAAMADDRSIRDALILPVAGYLENTPCRVPFSDWYGAESGRYYHFIARSVQGGIFMPLLREKLSKSE